MFDFLKKKHKGTKDGDLAGVELHLNQMGYDLLAYGVAVAQAELISGYNAAEVASHLAIVTLALDIKEANDDVVLCTALMAHGVALAEHLKTLKDAGMFHPTQYQNDVSAILGLINPSPQQMDWVAKVLDDPVIDKERLAISKIDYKEKLGK